ncbi:DNA segregation ATPase FtsK/SpoIIIE, S-DNA-T family [Ruania alba]|uniref:DNA segregation ATPase FtsK/SpoIIIE, S-DNA-T family n=1 Tax=Ruania alba TaxID=648782 RepID=A0A1H5D0J7_9MICO|nr:DNA segregation ATPase FtsK/SpoIIIE, S-DNA-T family [Ruania alba]
MRDLGSVNGTLLRPARPAGAAPSTRPVRLARRPRRVGRRWRPVPVGSMLVAGSTVLQVRTHPALTDLPEPEQHLSDGLIGRLMLPILMALTMIPLLLSGGGSGWRIVLVIAMPVAIVLAVLWPALRERARRRLRRPDRHRDEPARVPFADPAEALAWPGADPGPGSAEATWELGDADERTPRPRRPDLPLPARRHRIAESLRYGGPPGAGAGLALVGAPEATHGLGRWLVARIAATEARAVHPPATWEWAAGLAERHVDDVPPLRVHDLTFGGTPPPAADPAAAHLVLTSDLTDVPLWCTTVIVVRSRHNRQVTDAWARGFLSALAAQRPTTAGLPARVHLGDLLGPAERSVLTGRWSQGSPGLPAVLGVGDAGTVELDLARDGPHALVAGTTGSGKSELLLAWILAMAHAGSPEDVSFVLIDYKGGATFAPLQQLRHVVGLVTDLDSTATGRALASLRAELRSRERQLAEAGVHDLAEYRRRRPTPATGGAAHIGRLVVVVDEFRAMADAHPEHLEALVRLAAQGRSLGIHLILATQRPGGAITPDMRANLTTRLCLRVLEESDALDAIGESAPARLPRIPGRTVLRAEDRQVLQSAWCGPPDAGWLPGRIATLNDAAAALTAAEPWRATQRRPWAPPLPDTCTTDELRALAGASGDAHPPAGLPIARTDLPEEQRLGTWHWPGGTMLVSGPSGTGRSTAAQTVIEAALRTGRVTHVVAEGAHDWPGHDAPSAGTWCDPTEVRRVRRVLEGLVRSPDPALLVIDDVDTVLSAVEETGAPGEGADLLGALLRRSRRLGLEVLLTAPAPAHRWAAVVDRHLVLCPRDAADAVMVGGPRELVGTGWPPGRGVLVERTGACVMQVGVATPDGAAWVAPSTVPWRVRALPERVELTDPLQGEGVLLGVGGDAASAVRRHPATGQTWLVAGPAGAGRSTVLRTITDQLSALGWQVSGGEMVEPDPARHTAVVLDDADRLRAPLHPSVLDDPRVLVIAATRPDGSLTIAHPLGTRLRDPDLTLVLGAGPVSHLPPVPLRHHQEPEPPPGRGVLVDRGAFVPLQVATVARTDTARNGRSEHRVRVSGARGGGERCGQQEADRDRDRRPDPGHGEPPGQAREGRDQDRHLQQLPGDHRGAAPPAPLMESPHGRGEERSEEHQHEEYPDVGTQQHTVSAQGRDHAGDADQHQNDGFEQREEQPDAQRPRVGTGCRTGRIGGSIGHALTVRAARTRRASSPLAVLAIPVCCD